MVRNGAMKNTIRHRFLCISRSTCTLLLHHTYKYNYTPEQYYDLRDGCAPHVNKKNALVALHQLYTHTHNKYQLKQRSRTNKVELHLEIASLASSSSGRTTAAGITAMAASFGSFDFPAFFSTLTGRGAWSSATIWQQYYNHRYVHRANKSNTLVALATSGDIYIQVNDKHDEAKQTKLPLTSQSPPWPQVPLARPSAQASRPRQRPSSLSIFQLSSCH